MIPSKFDHTARTTALVEVDDLKGVFYKKIFVPAIPEKAAGGCLLPPSAVITEKLGISAKSLFSEIHFFDMIGMNLFLPVYIGKKSLF